MGRHNESTIINFDQDQEVDNEQEDERRHEGGKDHNIYRWQVWGLLLDEAEPEDPEDGYGEADTLSTSTRLTV